MRSSFTMKRPPRRQRVTSPEAALAVYCSMPPRRHLPNQRDSFSPVPGLPGTGNVRLFPIIPQYRLCDDGEPNIRWKWSQCNVLPMVVQNRNGEFAARSANHWVSTLGGYPEPRSIHLNFE